MPKLWKSAKYFTQLSGGKEKPPAKVGKFEDLAAETTTNEKPLIFSLDDIILTDKDLNPVKWIPDNKTENRISIFCNTFSHSGPRRMIFHRKDYLNPMAKLLLILQFPNTFTGNNLGFFTQLPKDEKTEIIFLIILTGQD